MQLTGPMVVAVRDLPTEPNLASANNNVNNVNNQGGNEDNNGTENGNRQDDIANKTDNTSTNDYTSTDNNMHEPVALLNGNGNMISTKSDTAIANDEGETHNTIDIDHGDIDAADDITDADVDDDRNDGDLQFKKKDFRKSRAQLFQSVLLTASLKLLKQQYPGTPALVRNPSAIATNSKNHQLFIQAPVLLLVLNLRSNDVEIGQQLPFDGENTKAPEPEPYVEEDNGVYDETMLQQQRLTLNALKKLSLLLAPIIRSDDDDEPRQHQLTTKLLNSVRDKRKPYQPAQVDLSQFSSLTRQGDRRVPDRQPDRQSETALSPGQSKEPERQIGVQSQNNGQAVIQPGTQSDRQSERQSGVPQTINGGLHSGMHSDRQSGLPERQSVYADRQSGPGMHSERIPIMSAQSGRTLDRQADRPTMSERSSVSDRSGVQYSETPSMLSTPEPDERRFGTIEHTLGPVVPPHDMNTRRKISPPKPSRKLQQIKGLRSPMYVPAVLRPTLDDVTPISSTRLEPIEVLPASSADSVRSTDLGFLANVLKTGPYTLDKRQYEYILRAAPTRRHWLKDEAVVECGIPYCHKHFNFFERRHHCRKCGGIFCKEHTSHYLYINHLAQFTTGGRGTLSRVCDNCIEEYNEFMKHEFGVGGHTRREDVDMRKEIFKKPMNPEVEVGSVPANWSWLSF